MKSLTFGLFTQVSDSGPYGPLVCLLIFLTAYTLGCLDGDRITDI